MNRRVTTDEFVTDEFPVVQRQHRRAQICDPPESGDQRRVWEAVMRSGKWLLALDGAVTSTFVEPRRRRGRKRKVVALPRGKRLMDPTVPGKS